MPNNKNYFSIPYLMFVPMHIGVLSIPIISSFTWLNFCYFLLGYILICGLGNNVGLHRWAGHKSIELGTYSKYVVLFFSMMAAQGHAIWWAAMHRGSHHRYSDTDNDPHSPVHGAWNAFHGWEWKHDPDKVNYKHVVDLLRDPLFVITGKYYKMIVLSTWLIVGYINIDLLLWMFLFPAVIGLHLEGLVNLLCHTKYGYRNFETKDNSHNVFLLGIFDWGNGWHNNHHAHASSFDFGSSISGKWYEFDPCRLFKPLLKL